MEVCVFGGTGFIGRHLCECLHRQRIPAFVVSRTPDLDFLHDYAPSIVSLTIDDPQLWKALHSVKLTVYLASTSYPSTSWRAPDHDLDANVTPAAITLRRLVEVNPTGHVILASSGGQIYGEGHTAPICEEKPLAPRTSYALGKQFLEETLAFFARVNGLRFTALRLANPVGRWQLVGQHGFVSATIAAMLNQHTLRIFGDGQNMRDYFDVDDLANLICNIYERRSIPCGIFNIGRGIGLTEREVITSVEQISGKPISVSYGERRPFDLTYSVLNCTKANTLLGWQPQTDLTSVIERIISSVHTESRWIPRTQAK